MAAEPFLDFAAYAAGIYSPPPALVALAARDPFWKTLGGRVDDPFGDGGETIRQRTAAAALGIAGYSRDGSLISGSVSWNGARDVAARPRPPRDGRAVMPSALFADLPPDELVDLACRLLTAFTAVVEFGQPGHDDRLFEAATARAMIVSLAAWIAHAHQDDEQKRLLLQRVIDELRNEVADFEAEHG